MTASAPSEKPPKKGLLARSLSLIERGGNALPHPVVLFAIFALLTIVASGVASLAGVEAVHPGTGKTIRVVNLMSVAGLHQILGKLVVNFTSFAPLGTVLTAMMGIGIAESSGLISTGLRMIVLAAPKRMLTFVVILAGVMSNLASDVGYVVLIPLGGMLFLTAGRHPIAGIAAAFAGVSAGFSANLMLGTIDPLLAGLTQESAQILRPGFQVNPACNYYFMSTSTLMVALAGTWVTERIVVPRLGKYEGDEKPEPLEALTPAEKRGLKFAAVTGAVFVALLLWATVPASGWLRHPETGDLLRSPFMSGIVGLIFLATAITGLAYGLGARTIRSEADLIKGMTASMKSLGLYLVICFFAAQFVAYFRWTNLGLILAIKGAGLLKATGLGEIPLIIALILLAAFINLFIGSASAKWAIMAPVFVPMFMLLGYSPALIQATYRIGDSTTNIITPVMAFFPLVVVFMERYRKGSGIGTAISTMLPYSLVFLLLWIVLLVAWVLLRLPLGPGAAPFL